MKLYHGSKAGIVGAIVPTSRGCCDFGRGFYMGSEPTQPMTLICRMEKPKFYTCEFDMSGLRVYRFEPTVDWAMFVAWNRGLMPEKYKDYYCEQQRMRARRQRELAIKAVDRIRLLHRKDGEGFFEIMERETGVKLYDA